MSRAIRAFIIIAAVMTGIASAAHAQQSSFSIAPPPIVAPTFEDGKTDTKVRLTYISLSGNGMDFSGGGIDGIARKAFSNSFAGDIQGGLFVLGGDIDMGTSKSSTTFMNMLFSANAELLAYKGDVFSTLLFAGPNLNYMVGSMEVPCAFGTCTDTVTITTSIYGFQGGIQFGIKAGDFSIDPFAMVMSQQGSSTMTDSFGNELTTTIDAYTTTSFGLDIVYLPWNMTLSAIVQEAAKQADKDKEGIKTNIYQIGWRF
jgi:hypothetical protein